jgi:hypothetical protein
MARREAAGADSGVCWVNMLVSLKLDNVVDEKVNQVVEFGNCNG